MLSVVYSSCILWSTSTEERSSDSSQHSSKIRTWVLKLTLFWFGRRTVSLGRLGAGPNSCLDEFRGKMVRLVDRFESDIDLGKFTGSPDMPPTWCPVAIAAVIAVFFPGNLCTPFPLGAHLGDVAIRFPLNCIPNA